MSQLTIEQVKDSKRQLEESVAELLLEFQEKSGLKIEGLQLYSMRGDEKNFKYIVAVELEKL